MHAPHATADLPNLFSLEPALCSLHEFVSHTLPSLSNVEVSTNTSDLVDDTGSIFRGSWVLHFFRSHPKVMPDLKVVLMLCPFRALLISSLNPWA